MKCAKNNCILFFLPNSSPPFLFKSNFSLFLTSTVRLKEYYINSFFLKDLSQLQREKMETESKLQREKMETVIALAMK